MELHIASGGASSASIQKAILLYGAGPGAGFTFATVHQVDSSDGTIQPGEALTTEALSDALSSLSDGVGERRWQSIDTRFIASGPGLMAWWSPKQTRHMFFDKSSGIESGLAAQPAMFWVAYRRSVFVFALEKDKRPTLGTSLCQPVHYNVFSGGQLCAGSSVMPAELNAAGYERMFFESVFTHPNNGVNWQTSHRGGVQALWRKLTKEKGTKPFPVEALKPLGKTVEQVLDSVTSSRVR
jgi:PRTRC genetic system protein B